MRLPQPNFCFCLCVFLLFISGCRSTPETNPPGYRVICDARLATVIEPLIPEAEKIFGPVRVEFLSVEDSQTRILAGSADAWFTLENELGLDYLLRMNKDLQEEEWPNFFSWRTSPEIKPGKTLLMYEVFQLGTGNNRIGEWVEALKAVGLEDLLAQQGLCYPVWEKGYNEELAFLNSVVFDELDFRRADVKEVISVLWEKGREQMNGIDLPDVRMDLMGEIAPITLKLRNVTFLDSLKTVTEISGLYYRMEGDEIEFYEVGAKNPIFYVLPPEKVTQFLELHKDKYPEFSMTGCDGYSSFPAVKVPLPDVEKLQYCMRRLGKGYGVTLTEYDANSGFLSAEGWGADKSQFKQFLRSIYFQPATFEDVAW